jgi:hypothetical protein
MITYSTNWMGPINENWIAKHGTMWSAGRIDIRGLDNEVYWGGCHEYSLPPMRTEDWNDFDDWLESFQTHELWEFDDIVKLYESASGRKIRWLENESKD